MIESNLTANPATALKKLPTLEGDKNMLQRLCIKCIQSMQKIVQECCQIGIKVAIDPSQSMLKVQFQCRRSFEALNESASMSSELGLAKKTIERLGGNLELLTDQSKITIMLNFPIGIPA